MAVITVRSLLLAKSGELTPIEAVLPGQRRWHSIDGAIELTVGETPVLTAALRDDVGDLWVYIAAMVAKVAQGEAEAETHFPDQPVLFRLSRRGGGMMEARCEAGPRVQRAVTAETELLRALCEAGIAFFDHLDRLGAPSLNFQQARVILTECLEGLPARRAEYWET
ncbi:MAG TPA: hypothetical protein VGB74_10520 [Actinoplanes sp.]